MSGKHIYLASAPGPLVQAGARKIGIDRERLRTVATTVLRSARTALKSGNRNEMDASLLAIRSLLEEREDRTALSEIRDEEADTPLSAIDMGDARPLPKPSLLDSLIKINGQLEIRQIVAKTTSGTTWGC